MKVNWYSIAGIACSLFVATVACGQDRDAMNKKTALPATTNSIGMTMVKINAGEFIMGNDGEIDYKSVLKDELHTPYLGKGAPNPYIKDGPAMNENPLEWDEKPSHNVKLTSAFYM